jgi:hypothetical protein
MRAHFCLLVIFTLLLTLQAVSSEQVTMEVYVRMPPTTTSTTPDEPSIIGSAVAFDASPASTSLPPATVAYSAPPSSTLPQAKVTYAAGPVTSATEQHDIVYAEPAAPENGSTAPVAKAEDSALGQAPEPNGIWESVANLFKGLF